MFLQKLVPIFVLITISIMEISAFAFNRTASLRSVIPLNRLSPYYRNIMEGNELVSEFEVLRGLYLLYRKRLYSQYDFEKALAENIKLGKIQKEVPLDIPFPCDLSNSRSLAPPNSVHKLRPGDIDIIAVIGDSISAGSCIITTSFTEVLYESRGVTFTGGGRDNWRRFLTLPNILKVFNPNLYGYAIADGLVVNSTSRLNIAEPTLMSRDLLFQAQVLLKRMRNDPNVNMQDHWKLLTIFVGNVDVCGDLCFYYDVGIPLRQHEMDLLATLRFLRQNVPRLLVNIIPPANSIQPFNRMKNIPMSCAVMHRVFCGCVINATNNDADRAIYEKKVQLWQDLDEHIAALPEFQTNNFAVVYQPFITDLQPPLNSEGATDLRFFASDCFHFSQISHASMANSLWNNMLQPVGSKMRSITPLFQHFECPTEERPYIATLGNS